MSEKSLTLGDRTHIANLYRLIIFFVIQLDSFLHQYISIAKKIKIKIKTDPEERSIELSK